jgi:hypothetical protein
MKNFNLLVMRSGGHPARPIIAQALDRRAKIEHFPIIGQAASNSHLRCESKFSQIFAMT